MEDQDVIILSSDDESKPSIQGASKSLKKQKNVVTVRNINASAINGNTAVRNAMLFPKNKAATTRNMTIPAKNIIVLPKNMPNSKNCFINTQPVNSYQKSNNSTISKVVGPYSKTNIIEVPNNQNKILKTYSKETRNRFIPNVSSTPKPSVSSSHQVIKQICSPNSVPVHYSQNIKTLFNNQNSYKNSVKNNFTSQSSAMPMAKKELNASSSSNAKAVVMKNIASNSVKSQNDKNNSTKLSSSLLNSLQKNGISISSLQKCGISVSNASDSKDDLEVPSKENSVVLQSNTKHEKFPVNVKNPKADVISKANSSSQMQSINDIIIKSNSLCQAKIRTDKRKISPSEIATPNKLLCIRNSNSMPKNTFINSNCNPAPKTSQSNKIHPNKDYDKTTKSVIVGLQSQNQHPLKEMKESSYKPAPSAVSPAKVAPLVRNSKQLPTIIPREKINSINQKYNIPKSILTHPIHQKQSVSLSNVSKNSTNIHSKVKVQNSAPNSKNLAVDSSVSLKSPLLLNSSLSVTVVNPAVKPDITKSVVNPLVKPDITKNIVNPTVKPEMTKNIVNLPVKPDIIKNAINLPVKPDMTKNVVNLPVKPDITKKVINLSVNPDLNRNVLNPSVKPDIIKNAKQSVVSSSVAEKKLSLPKVSDNLTCKKQPTRTNRRSIDITNDRTALLNLLALCEPETDSLSKNINAKPQDTKSTTVKNNRQVNTKNAKEKNNEPVVICIDDEKELSKDPKKNVEKLEISPMFTIKLKEVHKKTKHWPKPVIALHRIDAFYKHVLLSANVPKLSSVKKNLSAFKNKPPIQSKRTKKNRRNMKEKPTSSKSFPRHCKNKNINYSDALDEPVISCTTVSLKPIENTVMSSENTNSSSDKINDLTNLRPIENTVIQLSSVSSLETTKDDGNLGLVENTIMQLSNNASSSESVNDDTNLELAENIEAQLPNNANSLEAVNDGVSLRLVENTDLRPIENTVAQLSSVSSLGTIKDDDNLGLVENTVMHLPNDASSSESINDGTNLGLAENIEAQLPNNNNSLEAVNDGVSLRLVENTDLRPIENTLPQLSSVSSLGAIKDDDNLGLVENIVMHLPNDASSSESVNDGTNLGLAENIEAQLPNNINSLEVINDDVSLKLVENTERKLSTNMISSEVRSSNINLALGANSMTQLSNDASSSGIVIGNVNLRLAENTETQLSNNVNSSEAINNDVNFELVKNTETQLSNNVNSLEAVNGSFNVENTDSQLSSNENASEAINDDNNFGFIENIVPQLSSNPTSPITEVNNVNEEPIENNLTKLSKAILVDTNIEPIKNIIELPSNDNIVSVKTVNDSVSLNSLENDLVLSKNVTVDQMAEENSASSVTNISNIFHNLTESDAFEEVKNLLTMMSSVVESHDELINDISMKEDKNLEFNEKVLGFHKEKNEDKISCVVSNGQNTQSLILASKDTSICSKTTEINNDSTNYPLEHSDIYDCVNDLLQKVESFNITPEVRFVECILNESETTSSFTVIDTAKVISSVNEVHSQNSENNDDLNQSVLPKKMQNIAEKIWDENSSDKCKESNCFGNKTDADVTNESIYFSDGDEPNDTSNQVLPNQVTSPKLSLKRNRTELTPERKSDEGSANGLSPTRVSKKIIFGEPDLVNAEPSSTKTEIANTDASPSVSVGTCNSTFVQDNDLSDEPVVIEDKISSPKLSLKRNRTELTPNRKHAEGSDNSLSPDRVAKKIKLDEPSVVSSKLPGEKTQLTLDIIRQYDVAPAVANASSSPNVTSPIQFIDLEEPILIEDGESSREEYQTIHCLSSSVPEDLNSKKRTLEDIKEKFLELLQFSEEHDPSTSKEEKLKIRKNMVKSFNNAQQSYVESENFNLLLDISFKKLKRKDRDNLVILGGIRDELKKHKKKDKKNTFKGSVEDITISSTEDSISRDNIDSSSSLPAKITKSATNIDFEARFKDYFSKVEQQQSVQPDSVSCSSFTSECTKTFASNKNDISKIKQSIQPDSASCSSFTSECTKAFASNKNISKPDNIYTAADLNKNLLSDATNELESSIIIPVIDEHSLESDTLKFPHLKNDIKEKLKLPEVSGTLSSIIIPEHSASFNEDVNKKNDLISSPTSETPLSTIEHQDKTLSTNDDVNKKSALSSQQNIKSNSIDNFDSESQITTNLNNKLISDDSIEFSSSAIASAVGLKRVGKDTAEFSKFIVPENQDLNKKIDSHSSHSTSLNLPTKSNLKKDNSSSRSRSSSTDSTSGDRRTQIGKNEDERNAQRIRKLEKRLKELDKAIKKCQKRDLSLDDLDDIDSPYIKESKYKRQFVLVYKLLCKLKKVPARTGRIIEKKFHYEGSRYKLINEAIEKFINKKKAHEKFPDYSEVFNVIKQVDEVHDLGFNELDIANEAKRVFEDIGGLLKERRCRDEKELFGCYLTDDVNLNNDPAECDETLKKTLEENSKKFHESINQVIDHYVEKQQQAPAEENADNDDEEEDDIEDDEKDEIEDNVIADRHGNNDDLPGTAPTSPAENDAAPFNRLDQDDDIEIINYSDKSTDKEDDIKRSKESAVYKPNISESVVIEDSESSGDLPSIQELIGR